KQQKQKKYLIFFHFFTSFPKIDVLLHRKNNRNYKNNIKKMSSPRFKAAELAISRPSEDMEKVESLKPTSIYGKNVFTIAKMKDYLSKSTYKELIQIIGEGTKISRELADQIAQAMKTWAISNGTTHYTHWFQPLTGTTAEKHDAFFE